MPLLQAAYPANPPQFISIGGGAPNGQSIGGISGYAPIRNSLPDNVPIVPTQLGSVGVAGTIGTDTSFCLRNPFAPNCRAPTLQTPTSTTVGSGTQGGYSAPRNPTSIAIRPIHKRAYEEAKSDFPEQDSLETTEQVDHSTHLSTSK